MSFQKTFLLCFLLLAGGFADAAEKSYRYFRFAPTKLRDSPTLSNSVQISEFEFRFRGGKVSMAGVIVTNPGGNNPAAEAPAKVSDSDTGTKWLDFNKRDLVFTFPGRTTIDSYNFATANDSQERDPISWRLEASEDGTSWIRIDEVNDYATATARLTFQAGFSLPATGQVPGDPVAPQWHPDEILSWNPATDPDAPFNRSTVPLASRLPQDPVLKVNSHARANEARVMPLIAFNTIPVASAQGSQTVRYHTPLFWQYMQGMTFWGGSDRDSRTILTPSAHVVDAAHRNGVPVLGKIFFAFSSDSVRLAYVRSFLQKSGAKFPVADKLIEVANYYGFDGWFINQETSGTTATDAQNMRDFIKYFRSRAPNLQIMWYDAMAESGARSFQNALTDQNDGYLKEGTSPVAQTMFLNFWWGSAYNDTTNMPNSRQRALDLGLNPYDVYAGIDTEGAGYSTSVDWNSLFPEGQPHRLSLGIYRPEWTFNSTSSTSSFHSRELRYWVGPNGDPSNTSTTDAWKGIAHYIPDDSVISRLPFVTNFNVGQGSRYAINGTTLMTGAWSNLSLQDILPTWRWIVRSTASKLTPSLELDDAYYGGTSLKVAGNLDGTNDIKLYRCSLRVGSNTELRIAFKRGAVAASCMQVALAFEDSPNTFQYLDVGTATSTGWNTKTFSLAQFEGKKIAVIALRFISPSSVSGYSIRVGQLAIYDKTIPIPDPSQIDPLGFAVDRQETVDADTLSLRLRWEPSSAPVQYYNVYARHADKSRTWLGATPNSVYFVPAARRKGFDPTMNIEVEAVRPDFSSSSPAQMTVTFPPTPNVGNLLSGGLVLGTTGSSGNSSNTRDKVFDGNVTTFFDAPDADGAWVGRDLGAGNEWVITAVRFYPRTGWNSRMLGGVFQGANTADFANPVTLATVQTVPMEGVYTVLGVSNAASFRYIRYLSPKGGYCNLAELQFYGVKMPPAPSGLNGRLTDGKAVLSWNGAAFANIYRVKRSNNSGGPFAIIADTLKTTSFTESGLTPQGTYFYVVSAVNEAGEGSDSAQITVSDPFAQWIVQQGWNVGEQTSGFAADADGDGVPNGLEYAAPAGIRISSDTQGSAVVAEIRADPGVTATLLSSPDLVNWTVEPFTKSSDQSEVPGGFVRWTSGNLGNGTAQQKFYRLKLTR